MATDFQVRRDDLHERRFVEAAAAGDSSEPDGSIRLRVDEFAFTANNVTYGAMGDAMRYWEFFPAPDGWGRIPAWGFGTVVRSTLAGIAEGSRYYGYFPMSSEVAMRPGRITATTFADTVPHRAGLHPLYNQYTLAQPSDPVADALQLLLRPLFITSFILDDFFADNAFFGARRIVVSSASSKTAYGMAFLLAKRLRETGADVEIAGLTARRNVAFVENLGFYDRVLAYDRIDELPADAPALFVDFAANAELRHAVHARLAEHLRYSSAIGLTHWDRSRASEGDARKPAGPAPVTFFAPAQIKKRTRDWGSEGFAERFDHAWDAFVRAIREHGTSWLRVSRGSGSAAVERVYDDALAGALRPDEGHVLSLL